MSVLDEQATASTTESDRDLVVLTINASWRCPVKCSYCHVTMKASLDDRSVIDSESLKAELLSARANGVTEIRFSGGEPVSLGKKLFDYTDLVYDTTGIKPNLLTSGAGINDRWLKRASGKFQGIYVSVENPFNPLQTFVDNRRILRIMRENFSEDLPFQYGLTLVTAEQFGNLSAIFELLYDNMYYSVMPQLDYPCLKGFAMPDAMQLATLQSHTREIFRTHGLVPYFFVNLIGSPVYLFAGSARVVLNLHPDGRYDTTPRTLGVSGFLGCLRCLCSVRARKSVSGWQEGISGTRVSRRGWRAVPPSAVPRTRAVSSFLTVLGPGKG
jgi:hypothetical protein